MAEEVLMLSIGMGLAIGLLFSEFFSLAPGGLVVPGYLALMLQHPVNVLLTLVAALVTFALARILSSFILLYGRRRTVLMILIGYLVGLVFRLILHGPHGLGLYQYDVIGYIIPGLIALWLDRQGIVETVSTLTIVSVMVRLVLILTVGNELNF